ncbi:MAG: hypothetical protein HUU16_21645 [Candidatus Omnitrophica bacterium]|nr:hypothetical protein [Candidatus Omnitrophota bacterium]
MSELANAMSVLNMPERGLTPVAVLVSDGQPTDDFLAGLANLEATPWGKKAIRLAVGIGRDADFEMLRRFVNQPTCPPFHAHNAPMLAKQISFASTAALKCASAPHSQTRGQNLPGNCAPISVPASLQNVPVEAGDVW